MGQGFGTLIIGSPNVRRRAAATPQEQADLKRTMDKFRKVLPNYPDKPLSPEQSVKKVLAVIDNLKPEDTGSFRNAALT